MTADQDRFLHTLIQAIHEWWAGLGAFAWMLAGVLVAAGIASMLLLLHSIWKGSLSQRPRFNFHGPPVADEPLSRSR
jgi:peptidoglycan biosynthesis protein MviN/MurJ (putative lipid II flippase)